MVWTCTKLTTQHHERTQGWRISATARLVLDAREHDGMLTRHRARYIATAAHQLPRQQAIRLRDSAHPSFFARTGSFAAPVGLSPSSAFGLVGESLQVVTSPCCPRQLPDVIPRVCAWMLDPIPRRYTVCSHLFLPRCHRPSPWKDRVGFPLRSCERLLAGHAFEAAGIS